MRPPADVYRPSKRHCPDKVPAIEHKGVQRILRVGMDGKLYFKAGRFFLSETLAGDTVGITEVEDDVLTVTYGPLYLGFLNFRSKKPTIHICS